MTGWFDRRLPELVAAFSRFPFAIALAALGTAIVVGALNEIAGLRDETGARLALGLAAGAIFAVAGALHAESRPQPHWLAALLGYVLPVVVMALAQVRDTGLVFPYLLPIVGVLWTSVAAFTRPASGPEREREQDRFWWLNQRALIMAALTGAGYLLIVIGVVSIERALDILFRVNTEVFAYRWLLPILGGWVAPLIWLSTVPRLEAFEPQRLAEPDFLSRAIGALGQYIAAPLLLIYGAILVVYAGQIAIARELPNGLIGWMVLWLVALGAGTFLVLHPPFMRANPLVRFFRRWWWWLTLVPLALFGVAVGIRVGAYGLTLERVLIIAGGVWAAILALLFLVGRGDIRLIPGLAALVLAGMAVGPWNAANLAAADQAGRLDRALLAAGPERTWTPADRLVAHAAIGYLYSAEARPLLEQVALKHGYDLSGRAFYSPYDLNQHFGIGEPGAYGLAEQITAFRSVATPVDVSATPWLLGSIFVYEAAGDYDQFGIRPSFDGNMLVVEAGGAEKARVDLAPFLSKQKQGEITDPWIDFSIDGRPHRIVVDGVTIALDRANSDQWQKVRQLNGMLFAGPAPAEPVMIDDAEVREHPAMLLPPDAPRP